MLLTTGTVAVISGASSGLGRAVARRIQGSGATVVGLDMTGAATDAGEGSATGHYEFVETDVTDAEAVDSAFNVAGELGEVRVAVNCAGIAPSVKLLSRRGSHDPAIFEKVVNTNLVGSFNCMRSAARLIADSSEVDGERGVIVNTASTAAFDGQIGQIAYSASKAGIVGLTLPAARDLSSLSIRVVAIAPGAFETPMVESMSASVKESLAEAIPHPRRLGRPEEFASLVCEMISNTYINGEVVRLDGALRMAAR